MLAIIFDCFIYYFINDFTFQGKIPTRGVGMEGSIPTGGVGIYPQGVWVFTHWGCGYRGVGLKNPRDIPANIYFGEPPKTTRYHIPLPSLAYLCVLRVFGSASFYNYFPNW